MNNKVSDHIFSMLDKFFSTTKFSCKEIGDIFGVSSTSVFRWKSHECLPNINLFPKLCELLNITINELMGIDKVSPEIEKLINVYNEDDTISKLIDFYNSSEEAKEYIKHTVWFLSSNHNK